jgi:tyrosine aminotransferase
VSYRLLNQEDWQVDLEHVTQLVEQYNVRGMVVNNPSNPTGAVWSRQHLEDICDTCERLQVPVIADEVYGDLVFAPNEFVPLASVAAERGSILPVITCSGIGKQYLLPGWRVGWAVFQDK